MQKTITQIFFKEARRLLQSPDKTSQTIGYYYLHISFYTLIGFNLTEARSLLKNFFTGPHPDDFDLQVREKMLVDKYLI